MRKINSSALFTLALFFSLFLVGCISEAPSVQVSPTACASPSITISPTPIPGITQVEIDKNSSVNISNSCKL